MRNIYTQTLMKNPSRLVHIVIVTATIASASTLYVHTHMHAELTNPSLCGNRSPDAGEQCDKGSENGVDADGAWCSLDCEWRFGKITTTTTDPYCGDGTKDDGESCDNGTLNSNTTPNACRTSCEPASCGDGVRDNGEECADGNDTNNDSCTNACKNPRCRDGITQASHNEECDDGNGDDADGCTTECKNPICGDGIKQESRGEECDDGNKNGSADSVCSSECKTREDKPSAQCGDGHKDDGEECDDGNETNTDACTNLCKNARCGDNIVQGNEQCDEGVNNGKDIPGATRCTQECTYPIPVFTSSTSSTYSSVSPEEDDDDTDTTPTTTTVTPVVPVVRPAAPVEPTTTTQEEHEPQKNHGQNKLLIDAMRKAREAAGLQIQTVVDDKEKENTSDTDNTETEATEKDPEETDDGLRCFDSAGNIVGKRSECDHKQENIMLRKKEVSDVVAQEDIRKKLLGDNNTQEKSARLIESLTSARARLQKISHSGKYNEDVQKYFEQSIAWLDRGITYFSTEERSIEEIQQMAGPVRQLIEQATALIRQQNNLPSVTPDINPIIAKTEGLLLKFRESFIALAQGKVQLDRSALEKYSEAANLFANVKTLCLEDSDQCSHINDVLEILKFVQGPLVKLLEENPEIYKRVQEKFEQ